jgi:hypothetical protein
MHEVVLFGELMSIAVIVMCLLFVTVDLGHPERFHHMIPPFGIFNWPGSILSWDVIVLNGYLLLNVHICGYLLYCRYRQRRPSKAFYIPFVFISIAWAVSIHTVTAFLYVGLARRSYWHHRWCLPVSALRVRRGSGSYDLTFPAHPAFRCGWRPADLHASNDRGRDDHQHVPCWLNSSRSSMRPQFTQPRRAPVFLGCTATPVGAMDLDRYGPGRHWTCIPDLALSRKISG